MKQKVLSIILATVLCLTNLSGIISVYAASASITLNKTAYTINEKMVISVAGVSDAQIESGAFTAIYKKDDRHENYGQWEYVINMINGKWEATAPNTAGDYEIRLYADESYESASLLVSIPVTVTYITDKTAVVKTDKPAYTPNEQIVVTVSGVTETQMQSQAFAAIYKKDDRHENYGQWEYVINMINGKWKVNAPNMVGDYEIRLYAAEEYVDEALYVSVPLKVTYSTAAATLHLNKNSFAPNEKISVTVSGVTEAQKQTQAYAAIYKKGDRHENYGEWQYVIHMINGKWDATAPSIAGEYEMRLYAAESYTADALLVSVPFAVGGGTAAAGDISEGYNGISGWAVGEVQAAIKDNLTTNKVMVEFQKSITREEFCELAVKLYEAMTGKAAQPAPADTFSDTTNTEILKAYNLGIVKGVGNSQFAPNNSVTRQEIATMLLKTVKVALPALDTTVANPPAFIDSYDIDSWALEGVHYFASKEIIKGANGAFLPKANCTCEAAIALIKRVFDSFSSI